MPSTLSLPRAMLRRLAESASQNPIEVILTIFCVVTLAYFQLLHAITTSNFFEVDSSVVASYPFFFGQSAGAAFGAAAGDEGASPEELGLTHRMFVRRAGAKGHWEPFTTQHTNGTTSEADTELLAGAASYLVQPILVVDSEQGGAPGTTRHLRDTALPHVARALQTALAGATLVPTERSADSFYVHDAAADLTAYAFARVQKQGSAGAAAASAEVAMTRKELLAAAEDEEVLLGALAASEQSMPAAKPLTLAGSPASSSARPLRLLPILSARDAKLSPSARRRASAAAEELHSVRWMAYAVRALVIRFWSLLRKADSADIFVMLSAYLLMHGTFINLFLSMRKFGSRFWLGASVLISSIFGFLCALTAASFLGVAVDPVCLSEALPFLVITVGFEKPFLLTRAIFKHPSIVPNSAPVSKSNSHVLLSALSDSQQQPMPDASSGDAQVAPPNSALSREESFMRALTARLRTEPTLRWDAAQPMPAHDVVVEAVEQVGPSIVRDYAIEIAVMAVGATSGVSGLREFCQLAALILLFDCIFLFAFFVAILTIMVEVHRIKIMRGMKRPRPSTPPNVDSDDALNAAAANDVPASPSSDSSTREGSPDRHAAAPKSLWRRVVTLILGRVPFEKRRSGGGGKDNPVARLKLLLIAAFLTLHSFNFVSTLTTQSAFTRHHAVSSPSLYQSVTDAAPAIFGMAAPDAPALSPFLEHLVKNNAAGVDIVARVAEPVIYVLVDASSEAGARTDLGSAALNASGANVSSTSASSLGTSAASRANGSLAILDSFLTGWSIIVGDPVISKWMSLALAISIFLNAYLLKGIATGDAAEANAAGAAAFAAARMIGAHLSREDASTKERSRPQRRWSDRQDATELNAYHRSIAAQSQQRAKSTLSRSSERAGQSNAAPIALAINGEQVDSTASTPQQRESRAAPVEQSGEPRSFEDLVEAYAGGAGVFTLSDEEVITLAQRGKIAGYALEKVLQDNARAVRIRRALVSRASSTGTLERSLLPHQHYNYDEIIGACCENVVGFMPIPVGIAGPLTIDGQVIPIPMATTEGTLVASTSRGCKALNAGGGVTTVLTQDAMTRGPALDFPSITAAARAKRWVDSQEGAAVLKGAFDSTSRFARLSSLHSVMAGRTLYVRFATSTGDAMGMNMIGKGVEHALAVMQKNHFPEMVILSLSGNYCIDKKPAALNWIMGRGKSVVAEAVIPGDVVSSVLKCTVASLVNLNIKKNLVGSAMAGSVGGFNAHAANILTAMFLATGQDPAQNVESSQCMTLMEAVNDGKDLLVTCSMPCIEVGTVGGGTALSPQRSMLALMGVAGAHPSTPGANAQRLARIICAAVMAAEISLLGALSAGHLIRAHMAHNRSAPPTPGAQTPRLQMPQPHFPGTMTPLVAPPVESRQASPRTLSLTSISENRRDRRAASSG